MLDQELRDLVEQYLASEIGRSVFAQRFGGIYFQVRNGNAVSSEARRLCDLDSSSFRGTFSRRSE